MSIDQAMSDANIKAVFLYHRDLTIGEAARLANVKELATAQSIGRLRASGVIEPREPRRCGVFNRSMAAFIVAPRASR
jgi:hypothetical protein